MFGHVWPSAETKYSCQSHNYFLDKWQLTQEAIVSCLLPPFQDESLLKADWDFKYNYYFFVVFLRFQAKESVSGVSQVKSSIQRGIKTKLVEQFPPIDDYIAQIFPKKEPLVVVKWWVLTTVFPVKLWTPEKLWGMFIVLWPIRLEM